MPCYKSNCCCGDDASAAEVGVKPVTRARTTTPLRRAQRERDMIVRQAVCNRLIEYGVTDWEGTDPIAELRAKLHKKLGRFSFPAGEERKYSRTYYFTFEWEYALHKFTDVTIAARYCFENGDWEYGIAWRNPLDKQNAPKLAQKIAREKMLNANDTYNCVNSTNTNPDWYSFIAQDIFFNSHIPRWAGNEAQRLENLAALWREVHSPDEE